MDTKKFCSEGVREDCVILSQNISSRAYEDNLGRYCCSQDTYKESQQSNYIFSSHLMNKQPDNDLADILLF